MTQLHNAQDAIKQAQYKISPLANPDLAMLDPLFWQELGKARGWNERMYVCGGCGVNLQEKEVTHWNKCEKCDSDVEHWITYEFWAIEWFKETRLSNGDETKFWESLP